MKPSAVNYVINALRMTCVLEYHRTLDLGVRTAELHWFKEKKTNPSFDEDCVRSQ